MFAIGFIIAIYAYLVLILGFLGLLKGSTLLFVSLLYAVFLFITRKFFLSPSLTPVEKVSLKSFSKIEKIGLVLLVSLFCITLIGALAPELAFDSLWYHLTLPKLYKELGSVVFIPGGLLYYSAMPKLTEMLYTASLFIPFESLPKFIHFLFGIGTSLTLFYIVKDEFGRKAGVIAALIFYSNLVVLWESTTAYIDIARTFFEFLALWGIVLWYKTKRIQWLVESALMLGIAVSTKLLALTSLPLFLLLVGVVTYQKKTGSYFKHLSLYVLLVLLVSFPWFLFSFLHTGNPVYPFFTSLYPVNPHGNLLSFLPDVFNLFLRAADPISPIYLIILPLSILLFKKFSPLGKMIFLFSLGSLVVWFLTPHTGGGRFFLPYLPAFTFLVVVTLNQLTSHKLLTSVILSCIFFIAGISLLYRGVATVQYLPVVFGIESKDKFLTKHLNFSYGDFYDTDGYFKKTIKPTDRILLYGFHNLYYVEFPFIHESWVKKGDSFNYIAVQGDASLPKRFHGWQVVYTNPITHVTLYSFGGGKWVY